MGAVEYNGYTAICCIVPEEKQGSEYPCSTPPPVCPAGFEEYDGQCYFFSVDEQEWTDAKATCEGMGATLARPTEAGNAFIVGNIKTSSDDWWIDLNDRDCDNMQYSDSSEDFLWNDKLCSTDNRYICQKAL